MASESPAPAIANAVSTQAIVIVGLRQANRAIAIAAIAISSDGPKLVANALLHGASVSNAVSGRFCRSRPCKPSDATALTMPTPSAPRMILPPSGPHPIQAAKKTPPTPTNSPR